MSSNYGNADYWDKRYGDEEGNPFDWLFTYNEVKDVLEYLLPDRNAKILLIGCGNAPFSPDMYENGHYNKLFNIDLSSVVVNQQAAKYPQQIWKVMNALNMDLPDNSFPVIIDKSLIDTLLCESMSKDKTSCMIKECYRVLEPGGRFITFSLHEIHEVEPSYRDAGVDWKVSCFHIKSDRWNDTDCRKRSRAHTMIVCDKACADGTYLHQHPLHIPTGTLSEDDYLRLKEDAQQVNLRYVMRTVPTNFLYSALFHALAGESAMRTLRFKHLEELYSRNDAGELEDLSITPVVDDEELLQRADFSLQGRVPEAVAALKKALGDVHKLQVVPGPEGDCAAPQPSEACAQ